MFGRLINLHRRRGLEHLADTAPVQQAVADVAEKQRQMAAAAAGADGDFARLFFGVYQAFDIPPTQVSSPVWAA